MHAKREAAMKCNEATKRKVAEIGAQLRPSATQQPANQRIAGLRARVVAKQADVGP